MVNPVPGAKVTAGFHARGQHWSCARNTHGGLHTGVDLAAAVGVPVLAARSGVTAHVDYSSKSGLFGSSQLVVRCPDGTEDFYAHMSSRIGAGVNVKAGQRIGAVGRDAGKKKIGAHLHFERHRQQGRWSCDNCVDPDPSLRASAKVQPLVMPAQGGSRAVKLADLRFGVRGSASVRLLQEVLNKHKLNGGQTLKALGNYLDQTDEEVRLCQRQHGFGTDPAGKSFVGPRQAEHLFAGTGVSILR